MASGLSAECKGPRSSITKTKERAAAATDAKSRATVLNAAAKALQDVVDE